jgi:cation/acetate symporter
MIALAAVLGATTEHRVLSITFFLVFVAGTLAITYWASKQTKTAKDFYAAGRSLSGAQNGIAISGDYMSAASFLGIAGLIALFGYDGFLYSVGFLVAYLVVLLLVAELLRNSGRYTMADVLAYRMRQRPVRTAASVSTLGVSIFYLVAQMVGAGALMKLLLGLTGDGVAIAAIVIVGALMIIYVTVGGMKGTTWVQIVKAMMLMAGTILMSIWVLSEFGFSVNAMFEAAKNNAVDAEGNPIGDAFLAPGLGTFYNNRLDLISLGLALVLGTAGLPHILMRFYTVPTARAARTSVNWAIGIIGSFYIMTTFLGFGAAALVGQAAIREANPGGNMAAPLLAEELGGGPGSTGGAVFLAVISAVAFATILAVVAGLTLTASSSFAHDFYANVVRRDHDRDEVNEVRVAKMAAFVIGAISIVIGIGARNMNVAFLVGLAFAVAASANLPTILFSLYWRRFNTVGAIAGIYVGLFTSLVLVAVGPAVIGPKGIVFKSVEPLIDLQNPGIISIPIGFLAAFLGTVLTSEPATAEKFEDLEVRALTGVGAE